MNATSLSVTRSFETTILDTKNGLRINSPYKLKERTIGQMLSDLQRPIPLRHAHTDESGNPFLHWQRAQQFLDYFSPGWRGKIVSVTVREGLCIVVYRITLLGSDGNVSRESAGSYPLHPTGAKRKPGSDDPIRTAEERAFENACRKLGIGRSFDRGRRLQELKRVV